MNFRIVYSLGMIGLLSTFEGVASVHAQEATQTLDEYLMVNGPTYFCPYHYPQLAPMLR